MIGSVRFTALVGSLTLFATAASAAPLIGLYTFEGAGGNFANVVDSSGAGNNPNFYETSTVSVTTGGGGYVGEAVKFTPTNYFMNGSGGGFTVPINIAPSQGNLTIGGWLKLDPTAATQPYPLNTFFSHDDGCWDRGIWVQYGTWHTTGGTGCTGPQNTGVAATTGSWQMIAVSMSGINASLYINGALVSTTVSNDFGTADPNLRFGAFDRSGTTEPWEGLMDNLFVFRAALTASEISTINQNGVAGILEVAGPAPAPAPAALALFGLGLIGLGALRRK